MSSKGYAAPLRLEVAAVYSLRWLYLGFSLLVILVLLWLPLPMGANILMTGLFLLIAVATWFSRSELCGRRVKLVWDASERWWWQEEAEEVELTLCPETFHSPQLVVLNFRQVKGRARRALVVTPAAAGEEVFRRLLVRLRMLPRSGGRVASGRPTPNPSQSCGE